MKKSTYHPMASMKPNKDQYIHFICSNGTETYGWFRGETVEISVQPSEEKMPVPVADVAAWRPVTMKP
jgi:hypothetical protein